MGSSITTRLISLLTACLALIFIAGMLIDYRLSRQEILQRLEAQSRQTVQSAVTDMENWLEAVESSTLFLARILQQREYSNAGLEQMLKDIVENNSDIYGAAIALNPDLVAAEPRGFAPYYFRQEGILTRADLASESYNYHEQAWFRDTVAKGAPLWVEPYFDRGGGDILMTTFAVPVYRVDEQGQRSLRAVVTADVPLAELDDYLRRLHLGRHGTALLLSSEGIILSSADRSQVMRHYSELAAGSLDPTTWRDMFRSAVDGQTITRQLECPQLSGQCTLLLGRLQSTGWPVGIRYSEEEVLAPLRDYQFKTLLLGLATLLAMALAIFLVTRRLTTPLKALAQATEKIARGDMDSPLPRARGDDEVARLVTSFGSMQTDLKQYIAEVESTASARSRLEGELNAARAIQMSLLPGGGTAEEQFRNTRLWASVRPARSVGGDLYTFFRRESRLWLALGDVSDKGAPAALFMARAVSLIPQLVAADAEPHRVMARLNDALTEGNDNCMFVTLFLGVLDLDSGELAFVSAGHSPPALFRAGTAGPLEQRDGPALGLSAGLEFPRNLVTLEPGDRLALFTDGVDEAFNADREMFGFERFYALLQSACDAPLPETGQGIFEAIDSFAGEQPQSDDIALLLLEFDAATEQAIAESFRRGERLVSRSQQWLAQAMDRLCVPGPLRGDLQLVLEEIISNVDKYAGLDKDDSIEVELRLGTDRVELSVGDGGVAFNPLEESERPELGTEIDAAGIGGLGVHLIAQLTDGQSYRRTGNRNLLRVCKHLR